MTWRARLREKAFAGLPPALRPVATYHYRRVRLQTDPEMEELCAVLRPGVRAIDVGANEGLYTHAFARTGALVEAFEPLPACHDVLAAYGRWRSRVCIHPVALGAQERMATLSVPHQNGRPVTGHASLEPRTGGAARLDVQVKTLDSFAFSNVAVIKVDVEGHELSVLRGAVATIRRWHPLLLLEIEQRHVSVPIASVFEEVSALGYRGEFIDATGARLALEYFDLTRHQRADKADTPSPEYVNNFIFRPAAGVR